MTVFIVSLCSKFVPRRSVRIFNLVVGSSLECVGFNTPDIKVIVEVMNRGDDRITFKLLDMVGGGGKQAVKTVALPRSIIIQTYIY